MKLTEEHIMITVIVVWFVCVVVAFGFVFFNT